MKYTLPFLMLLLWGDCARAQPDTLAPEKRVLDLKAVTVTNTNVVGSFHTLSEIDLNMHPIQSSQDLLQLVPGLFIAQHQGGGKAEQIFLRGGST
jgi:hypothetical protein